MYKFTDTHAHLDKLKNPPSETLKRASSQGVKRVLSIGTEPSDWEEVIGISDQFPEVYGTLGMHPHTSSAFKDKDFEFLKENAVRDKIVAIGEIGLDYYYENSKKDIQKEIFEKQMSLASDLNLPVQIHTRDAEEDTKHFLRKFKGRVRGLLHCFTGSYDLAKEALDQGFHISFSGILTFKNAEELRKTCKKIPLDSLHIETDSPFLSPEPLRGKENEPANTSLVAKKVSELHDVSLEDLSLKLQENTYHLFPKIKKKEEACPS